ncbi:unnamed protein product [Schistosoma margrebowiei]|uniref:Uncharacterized protein n=1 Tax=Schistosoma margrebowiei TaxID=48269 RepID=A0AA85AM42_9TREM|nr:unnamed protein product [Schistosoma margrebowiei]
MVSLFQCLNTYQSGSRDKFLLNTILIFVLRKEYTAVTKEGDCTPCFTKLNQYFPASDPTDKVQDFRLRFLKLLASGHKINRYLNERWFTAKSDVLKELQYLAFDIVEQLPEVLLDKVGSNEWVYNDVILLRFNTLLALIIRQQLFGKSICTEKDIFEIMHTYNSQSCPSQLI